jgi:hypothetical protein
MENLKPEPIVIGGRRFLELLDGTWEHDLHYMALYAESGLNNVEIRQGESPDDFSMRLLDELLKSRKGPEMLGTLLVPEERASEDWSVAMAQQSADFFRTVRGSENKEILNRLLARLFLDFFERGMVSFWTSRSSSTGNQDADHPEGRSGESGQIGMETGAH